MIRRLAPSLLVALTSIGSLAAAPVTLDWDDVSWPQTSTPSNFSETYPVGTGNVTVTTGGSPTVYAPGSPSIDTMLGQGALSINVNFPSGSSNQVPITIDFSHAGGVSNVSFLLFDVDRSATGSLDEVVVTATNGSTTFNPTIVIPGPANTFVPPNIVTGVSNSGSTSADGNAFFRFTQSGITRVTILYRYPGSASDPPGQLIGLHDISFNDSASNQPPVAQDDTAGTAVAPVDIDVLANDFDPEDEPLTLSLSSGTSAEGGTVVVDNNGTPGNPGDDFIVYTPPSGFLGVDTFTYTITDGSGGTDTATVTVNVPPIVADFSMNKTINDSSPTVGENVVFTLTLQNGGPSAATVTVTDQLSAGYAFVSASGPGSYSAASGVWSVGSVASGSSAVLQITAEVNGTGPYTNTAEVTSSSATDPDSTPGNSSSTEDDDSSVTPSVNGPPVAVDDAAATSIDAPITIDVLDNDSDPNGDTLILGLPSGTTAAGGTVVIDGDQIEYTPPPGFKGTDTFQYTASDSTGGSSTATVTVSVVSEQDMSLSKRADRRQALIGDFVRYTIELRNTGLLDLTGLTLVDQLPAGFHLVPGSAKLSGGSGTVTVEGDGPVTFSAIDLEFGDSASLTYVARVGALTLRGEVTNRVVATLGGEPIGNEATAQVTVTGDPDFEQTTILGKVFHDRNGDGWQDPGEEGIPGVRLATVEGLIVETDGHGRYHLAGIDGGMPERGRNFVVKLDASTLPADAEMTTENPRVRRITQGLVHRFDFGVRLSDSAGSCCRIVESKLGEVFFTVDSDAVWPDFVPVLHELAARLSAHGGGVLIVSGVSGPRMERVVATLRDLLGDERMGRIEIRQAEPTPAPPAGGAAECSSEACATGGRYDLELAQVQQMGDSVLGGAVPAETVGDRVDIAGRFRVSLPRGGLVWVTEDPTLVEPRLAVEGPDRLPVRDGALAEPATFHFYTNYAAFLERAEIVLYDPRDIEGVRSIAEIPLPLASYGAVNWSGPQGLDLVPGQELRYRLRVHDAAGHVDETRLHTTALVDARGFPVSPPRLLQGSVGAEPVGSPDEAPPTTPLGGNVLVLMPPAPKRTAETLHKTYTLWPELGLDKRTLSQTEMRQLEPIVADWGSLADVKVEIVGHTDSAPLTAAEEREFKDFLGVSEARANMVAEALRQAFGEQSVAISITPRGADEPVASNVTSEGQALNRRVELRVVGDRVSYRAEGRPDPRLVHGESGTAVPLRAGLIEAERSLNMILETDRDEEVPPGAAPSTGPVSRDAERDADGLDAVYGRNDLEQRSIPLRGSRVRIHGHDVRQEYALRVGGEPAPVDEQGRFVVERLLPIGDHRIEVRFTGAGGEGLTSEIPVSVTGSHLFYVALGEATVSGHSTSGDVEPLAGDERFDEDVLTEGRVALYLKGKIRGKYLITAQLDSHEEELGNLLSNLDEKDAGSVFRHLDPDRYYPVYGDDSTTWLDTASQGRMYVRVDWDRSQALWGNYETGLVGNEFAQYDRSLYGARVLHDSLGTTSLGQPRTHATAFASESQTALGHSEFLGTGGSLYYLKHRDILPGSEKAHIEVRDRDSGRVLSNVALVRGADYEIDEIQGRIVLARPLSQIVAPLAPTLIKDEPLDGDRSILLVDYEYVPTGFDADQLTAGARAKQWIGDHVAVGGTYVQENRGGEDYNLHGGDLTLQHGPGTYVKLEYASSEASQTSRFSSDNGGLTFSSANPVELSAREGEAVGVEARANVRELFGGNQDWVAAGWWRSTDAGFSVARLDPGLETTEYGAELIGQPLERLRVAARGSVIERDGDSEDQRLSLQGDYRVVQDGTLSAELRELSERESPSAQPVDALLGALRYSHRIGDALDVYGTGQFTIDDDGGRYAANDLGTVGTRLRVGSRTDLSAEVGTGDRGNAANVGLEHRIGPKHQVYGSYTLSTDRTDAPQANRFSVGQRSTLSDQTRIFSESQYLTDRDHSGVAHLFGLDFNPRPGWTLGFTLQSGALEAQTGGVVDRDAASVAAGHRGENTEWLSRVEVRNDSGAEERRQTLTSNRLDWKVREGVRLLFKLNLADTQDDLDENGNARLIESGVGVAFRPVRHDRLNLLARYTYLYDLPGADQENAGTDQRSNVLSTEGVYRVSRRWELGGKLAHRIGSLRTDRDSGGWFDSTTNFAALRVNFNVIRVWDLLVEYRWLDLKDAENTRSGFLAGLDRQLGQHFRVGAGYNFTDFSDDLTELEYQSHGWFVNFTTTY